MHRREAAIGWAGGTLRAIAVGCAAAVAGRAGAQTSVYVVNVAGDDVSVIDRSSAGVVTTIPVGPQPNGIAVTPDGGRAYVSNFRADTVSVIDTRANRVVADIPVGHQPVGIAVSPDGALAYVANRGGGSVSVIDTAANAVVATIEDGVGPGSNGIALTPDGAFAYVNNAFSKEPGTVSVVDTAANAVVGTVELYRNPKRVAISPDGRTAYVANFRSWNVSVIDTRTNTFTTGLRVSGRTVGVAVHPNGAYAYVTNLAGTVEVIETAGNTLTEPIAVGREPYAIAIAPRGGEAYVANLGDDTVSVVELGTDAVVAEIPVGNKPFAVAVACFGPQCTGPPFTPKPTRTPTVVPTVTATGTVTATPPATATPTLDPNAVGMVVGSATGRPGEQVQVAVSLHTRGQIVAGVQHDIGFDRSTAVAALPNGKPDCLVNPDIDKMAAAGFQPPGCTGVSCHGVRVLVLSLSNTDPIPDGSRLYTCRVVIAADAAPGRYRLAISDAVASDPDGQALPAYGVDGTVTVSTPRAAALPGIGDRRAAAARRCSAGARFSRGSPRLTWRTWLGISADTAIDAGRSSSTRAIRETPCTWSHREP